MNSRIKVSVIVPIFNVSPFLQKCLESLKAQTFQEIEFICINDGSTDNSLSILFAVVNGDQRFKIINKLNSGYGHTINLGLEIAQGDYIGIVESDDFVDPLMFQILYDTALKLQADVVKCDYFLYWGNPEKINDSNSLVRLPGNQPLCTKYLDSAYDISPSIWSGIYSRSLLDKNRIRFNETPGASFQDTSFNFKIWYFAQRAVFIKQKLIYYRQDNLNSSVKSETKVLSICDEAQELEKFFEKEFQVDYSFKRILQKRILVIYMWNYLRLGSIGRQIFFPILRDMVRKTKVVDLRLGWKHRLAFFIIEHAPRAFPKIIGILGN